MLREGNRRTFVTRISHMLSQERQAVHSRSKCKKELGSIRCPVQLHWGEADTWLHASRCPSWDEALGGRAAGVDVRLWPGVGHCVLEQSPSRTAEAVWQFMSRSH